MSKHTPSIAHTQTYVHTITHTTYAHTCMRIHAHTHTHTHKGSSYINIGMHEMHGQQTHTHENAHTSCAYTHSQLPDPECQGWLLHWVGHWQFVDHHQRQPKQVQSFHPGSNIIQNNINDNQCIQSSSIIILVSSVETHRWRTRDNKPSALPYTLTCVHVTNHPQRVHTTHDIVCKAMFYAYSLLKVDIWPMLDEQLTYICMAAFACHCERGGGVLGIKYIHVLLYRQNFLS